MGPLAAQQKPKLWQLNYFTDKAELEALGPKRPVVVDGGRVGRVRYTRTRILPKAKQLKKRFEKCIGKKTNFFICFFNFKNGTFESHKSISYLKSSKNTWFCRILIKTWCVLFECEKRDIGGLAKHVPIKSYGKVEDLYSVCWDTSTLYISARTSIHCVCGGQPPYTQWLGTVAQNSIVNCWPAEGSRLCRHKQKETQVTMNHWGFYKGTLTFLQ